MKLKETSEDFSVFLFCDIEFSAIKYVMCNLIANPQRINIPCFLVNPTNFTFI